MAPISFSAAFARAREAITTFTFPPKRDSNSGEETTNTTQPTKLSSHTHSDISTLATQSFVAMPPAFSDDEGSDVGADQSPAKKFSRARNPAKYEDEIPEDDDAESMDEKNGAPEGDDEEEGDDDDEDLDEEVYVVEKIMSHMIDKGKLLFEVKWEGYEKKSDRTWEPEENLIDNASDALNEYLKSIGGRDKLYEDSASALKTKKRGRPSSSTPQASGKRSRRAGDHPADGEPPLSAKAVTWKPPAGSWEEHIDHLDACEDEVSGNLMVYLTWKNGQKTQHPTKVIYQRCPQKMLQFYEQHVRIIKRESDGDSLEA